MWVCIGRGWVWVGREAKEEELPSGARGPPLKAGLPGARTGPACPWLIPALAKCWVSAGRAAGSSEPRSWGGSVGTRLKDQGLQEENK